MVKRVISNKMIGAVPKQPFSRIPKRCFSEKFRKLSYTEKLSVRRKMQRDSKRLLEQAKEVGKEQDAFCKELPEAKNVNVRAAMRSLAEIDQKTVAIKYQLNRFISFAEPYFVSFLPKQETTGRTKGYWNSVELAIHHAWHEVEVNLLYSKEMLTAIQLAKQKQRKF